MFASFYSHLLKIILIIITILMFNAKFDNKPPSHQFFWGGVVF